MIFIKIKTEGLVQVDDKTRIDIGDTFDAGESSPITKYEIKPSATDIYYDVTNDKYLDWMYAANGEQTISVKITQDDLTETDLDATIDIINAADDNLFSGDEDILPLEPDLKRSIEKGRSTYLDKHREAQKYILNDLDAKRIWKKDCERYIAGDIVDIQEFKEWSKYETLRIIYEGISNDVRDVFSLKAQKYKSFANKASERAVYRLDPDGDGVNDPTEYVANDYARIKIL